MEAIDMKTRILILSFFLLLGTASWTSETTSNPAPNPVQENYGKTPQEYVPYGRFTQPYKRFFLEPLEYTGYGRHIPEPEKVETVKIGFIGPIMKTLSVATGGESHEEVLGLKMLQGARLAIDQANAKGGYRGRIP